MPNLSHFGLNFIYVTNKLSQQLLKNASVARDTLMLLSPGIEQTPFHQVRA